MASPVSLTPNRTVSPTEFDGDVEVGEGTLLIDPKILEEYNIENSSGLYEVATPGSRHWVPLVIACGTALVIMGLFFSAVGRRG